MIEQPAYDFLAVMTWNQTDTNFQFQSWVSQSDAAIEGNLMLREVHGGPRSNFRIDHFAHCWFYSFIVPQFSVFTQMDMHVTLNPLEMNIRDFLLGGHHEQVVQVCCRRFVCWGVENKKIWLSCHCQLLFSLAISAFKDWAVEQTRNETLNGFIRFNAPK
ncbi:hypothetical protein BC89_27780 [Pseudomonas monteilii]|nr:hypothetical protein BC89_27780 [Pseudomonas monteilii]